MPYFISLFFIRFMLKMKKKIVTADIHMMLRTIVDCRLPVINALVNVTSCTSGRTATAKPCRAAFRNIPSGKKVLPSSSIGVMKRKAG